MTIYFLYFNRNFVNVSGNVQHNLRKLVGGIHRKHLHPNTYKMSKYIKKLYKIKITILYTK